MTATQKKVFIVDDDTFLLDMYSLKFSQSGYSVESALGPEAAIEKLKSGYQPEVMLLDVVMPTMNGFELLEKMKKENYATTAIKIILSNRGQQSDIAQCVRFHYRGR
jgi:two-component system sensor histidine kinase ChiS